MKQLTENGRYTHIYLLMPFTFLKYEKHFSNSIQLIEFILNKKLVLISCAEKQNHNKASFLREAFLIINKREKQQSLLVFSCYKTNHTKE